MTSRRLPRGVLALLVIVVTAVLLPACSGSDTPQPQASAAATDAPVPSLSVAPVTTEPKSGGDLPKVVDVALADPGPPAPALPDPEPLPDDPFGPAPEPVEGTIEIPRIGLSVPLNVGMTLTAINRGPSHWPGTAEPGGLGNMVIAGHRTTWSRPFTDLDLLQPGDQMTITTSDERWVYAVTGTDIVAPSATYIALQTYGHTATLFACHPKGSAAQRIVVRLQLLGPGGAPVDDATAWSLGAPTPQDDGAEGGGTATGGLPGEEVGDDPLVFPDE